MFLTPYTKLIVLKLALVGAILIMAATPFIIASESGFLPRAGVQAIFFAIEFFGAIFLYNEINRLKIIIKEKENADEKLSHIASEIKNLAHFKRSETGMKGIVLSGGTATRLFPLTATTSKQLLPVYDKQMIFYPLNTLIKGGIRDILVIISPDQSGQYLNLLGSIFKKWGVNLYFEVQKVPRGLADAFILGENFIGGGNVTLILGDNIFEDDLSPIISNFKSGGHIAAKKVPDPERFGVVKFDASGKAEQIVEKPKNWISDYAIPGFYIYDNEVVNAAKNLQPSERGEIEITDLHNHYLKKGWLQVTPIEGQWLDAGTFDSLLEAGNLVKSKKLNEKFHPIINEAIAEFNKELKIRTKTVLEVHNLQLRQS